MCMHVHHCREASSEASPANTPPVLVGRIYAETALTLSFSFKNHVPFVATKNLAQSLLFHLSNLLPSSLFRLLHIE